MRTKGAATKGVSGESVTLDSSKSNPNGRRRTPLTVLLGVCPPSSVAVAHWICSTFHRVNDLPKACDCGGISGDWPSSPRMSAGSATKPRSATIMTTVNRFAMYLVKLVIGYSPSSWPLWWGHVVSPHNSRLFDAEARVVAPNSLRPGGDRARRAKGRIHRRGQGALLR